MADKRPPELNEAPLGALRRRPAIVVGTVDRPDLAEHLHFFLPAYEQQKADRFRLQADRNAYCAAHFLLRACLDAIDGRRDWRFAIGEYGKPSLSPACAIDGLEFNISHSRSHVACALSFHGAIGVDTEDDYEASDLLDVAVLVGSATEHAAMTELAGGARPAAFARLWTVKEAVAKALGKGLNLDLRRFSVDLTRGTLTDAGQELGNPSLWKVEHRQIGKTHVAAALLSRTRTAEVTHFDWYRARLGKIADSNRCEIGRESAYDEAFGLGQSCDIAGFLSSFGD